MNFWFYSVFIPGLNSSQNLWLYRELLFQGCKECLFLGKRKRGIEPGGTYRDFLGFLRAGLKAREGKNSSVRQKCHLVIELRSSGGAGDTIFGLYFSLHIVISSSPKTSSTSGKKKFEGNQSKIHGFSLVGGTKLVNQTTKTHKCLWPSEFLCLIQLLNEN